MFGVEVGSISHGFEALTNAEKALIQTEHNVFLHLMIDEKSSMLNTALKTLKNEDETLKYILLQKNCLQEDEKYQLPPTFLMDVMELNEDLNKETTQKIEAFESTLYVEVKDIVENYNNETVTPAQLVSLKEYYYKKKYLQRILERIED